MEMWISFQYDYEKQRWVLTQPSKIYHRVAHIKAALQIAYYSCEFSHWEITTELPNLIECEYVHYQHNPIKRIDERYVSPDMKRIFVQVSSEVNQLLPPPPPPLPNKRSAGSLNGHPAASR